MELSPEVKAAIAAKVGESVLASLDGPARDAILAKAVAEFLGGYDLKKLIADAMVARALRLAAQVVESGAYDARVEAAIRAGLEGVLAKLPHAVAVGFTELLAGRGGDTYSRGPGLILKNLLG